MYEHVIEDVTEITPTASKLKNSNENQVVGGQVS